LVLVHQKRNSSIVAKLTSDPDRPSPWWIIALVIGSGILILCLGWCLLFLYLNICAADRAAYEVSKIVYQSDDSTQCDLPLPLYQEKEDIYRSQEEQFKEFRKERTEDIETSSSPSPEQPPDTSPPTKNDAGYMPTHEPDVLTPKADSSVTISEEIIEEDVTEKPPPTMDYPAANIVDRPKKRDYVREKVHETSRPKAASKARKIRDYDDNDVYKVDRTVWRGSDPGGDISTIFSTGTVTIGHPRPRSPVENGVLQPPLLLAADNTLSML
ncbi:hypothetical protein OESDEN_05760, partial [Oesophagostomum dentatum]